MGCELHYCLSIGVRKAERSGMLLFVDLPAIAEMIFGCKHWRSMFRESVYVVINGIVVRPSGCMHLNGGLKFLTSANCAYNERGGNCFVWSSPQYVCRMKQTMKIVLFS